MLSSTWSNVHKEKSPLVESHILSSNHNVGRFFHLWLFLQLCIFRWAWLGGSGSHPPAWLKHSCIEGCLEWDGGEKTQQKEGSGRAAERSCQGCFRGYLRAGVCACARGLGVREFEGSVVSLCVMLALALLCRGHPLSFVTGLFEGDWAMETAVSTLWALRCRQVAAINVKVQTCTVWKLISA